jgi:hypothetical protein
MAMQQMAQLTGLAYLTPSYLSVHPEFGPWFALRAAVSINCPASEISHAVLKEIPLDNPCTLEEEREMTDRMHFALNYDNKDNEGWKHWLSVRDVLQRGKQWRYSDEQINYHYTKNRLPLQ